MLFVTYIFAIVILSIIRLSSDSRYLNHYYVIVITFVNTTALNVLCSAVDHCHWFHYGDAGDAAIIVHSFISDGITQTKLHV